RDWSSDVCSSDLILIDSAEPVTETDEAESKSTSTVVAFICPEKLDAESASISIFLAEIFPFTDDPELKSISIFEVEVISYSKLICAPLSALKLFTFGAETYTFITLNVFFFPHFSFSRVT